MKIAKSRLIDIAICMMLGFVCSAIRAQDFRSLNLRTNRVTKRKLSNIYIPAGHRSGGKAERRCPSLPHSAEPSHKRACAACGVPDPHRLFDSRIVGSATCAASAGYPAGTDFTLPVDPSEKLLVYSGEFKIDAKIIAAPGDHLVEAKLHYQACDQNACMPPKTITVPIDAGW